MFPKEERFCKSVGKDIVYNKIKSKLKTVKHVHLGIVTEWKSESRSRSRTKFLIDALNRMGYLISYDEVNDVETSFAKHQMQHQTILNLPHSSYLSTTTATTIQIPSLEYLFIAPMVL